MRNTLVLACCAPMLLVSAACIPAATQRDPDDGTGYLISAQRIRETGATNAWDALMRSGAPIGMGESPSGEPRNLSRRGRNSLFLSSTPLLVVDDVRMVDFHYLRRIPAETIAYIRILNGVDGTGRYGTGSANGVVVVRTQPR